jgi:hypothetical protein
MLVTSIRRKKEKMSVGKLTKQRGITSSSGTKDHWFEARQGARFLGQTFGPQLSD